MAKELRAFRAIEDIGTTEITRGTWRGGRIG
jgi:hypothetical protein